MDGQESTDKQKNKSEHARAAHHAGGVNVGGLVVVVGALAVSGLVWVVTSQIKKRRDANRSRGGDEGRITKGGGMPSVLETPPQASRQNQCCRSYESQKTMPNQVQEVSMVPGSLNERNGKPASCGDQEVLIKQPVLAQDDPDEIQLPAPDHFDTGEDSPSIEVSEVEREDQSTVYMDAKSKEKTTFEPLPEKQADQGNYNCEYQETREQEGTEISSAESDHGNTRPPELVRDFPSAPEPTLDGPQGKMLEEDEKPDQFKGSSSSCNTINKFEDGTTRYHEDSKFFQKGKAMGLPLVSEQVEHKLKTGIWGLSSLGIMLMFCYYLPKTTVCLAVLFVTLLSFKA